MNIGNDLLPDIGVPSAHSLGALLSSGQTQGTDTPNENGTITQTERLYTVRSRGAFINEDQGGDRGTRAYIRLLTSDPTASGNRANNAGLGFGAPQGLSGPGNPLDLAINGGTYGGYASFVLTHVHGALDEKLQITETFGDGEVVYYFGRQPMVFSMAGYLIDSADNDWFVDWLNMYGHVMRGSQLAQNYELLKIVLPNMDLIGTMSRMSFDQDATNDVQINFEFQFIVKQMTPTPVTGLARPLSNSANVLNFDTVDSFLSQQGINSLKSQAGAVLSTIQNPGSSTSDIAASLRGFGGGLAGAIGPGRLSPPSSSDLSNGIDSITNAANSVTASVNDVFYSVSANLAGIRASLFSPIYGVLTSLTKLIRSVVGDVASIFNSLVSPVADIIRDVLNIAGQAAGLVSLINAVSSSGFGLSGIGGTGFGDTDIRYALGSLLNSRGAITTQPWTVTMTLRQLMNLGRIPTHSGFLANPVRASLSLSSVNSPSKAALLNSGPVPSAQTGAIL
jgi:hypothetical protein